MEKLFVPYELALKMKLLVFDEPCWGYYDVNEGYSTGYAFCYSDRESQPEIGCSAPLYQQAFRWFREKGYRFNMINDVSQVDGDYFYDVWFNGNFIFESHYIYKTYEEAELACLTKLIEIVKQTKN